MNEFQQNANCVFCGDGVTVLRLWLRRSQLLPATAGMAAPSTYLPAKLVINYNLQMITQNNNRNTRNSNTSASQLHPARVIQTQPLTYRNCELQRVVARCSPMPVVLTNGHSSEQHFPRRQFISQFHKPSCIFNRHGRFLWCGEIRRWPRHLVQCLSAAINSATKINFSPNQCSLYQCMYLISNMAA